MKRLKTCTFLAAFLRPPAPPLPIAAYTCICPSPVRPPAAHLCCGPCFLSLHPFLVMAAYTCICSSPVRPPTARLCHGPCFLSLYPFLDIAAYTCICSSPVRSPAAYLCHDPCFLWPPSTHMPSLFLFENQSYTLFKSQLKLNLLEASRSHSSAVISLPFGPFQSLESLLCILPLFSVLPGVSLCICLNFPTSLDQCLILSCINNDRQRVSAQ